MFVSCNLERDICYQEKVSNVIAALDLYRESHSVKPEYGIENVESDELACIFYTSGTTGDFSFPSGINKKFVSHFL